MSTQTTRTEYRVVGAVEIIDGREWLTDASPPLVDRDDAERLLRHRQEEDRPARLQARTVTDWIDVEEGER